MTSLALALAHRARDARPGYLAGFVFAVALLLAQGLAAETRTAPPSFADLVEEVSPAVVNITTSTNVAAAAGPGPVVPEGSPFEDFFRDFMDPHGGSPDRPRRSQALGSGFVISADGFIVTNNHVIEKADEIEIEFFSGDVLEATVVGTDPTTDLALLKVEADAPLPFVSFGDSDAMRVGDWVTAVGNPLGQGFSVSVGIISARGRAIGGTYDDYLQTDAAINRGNSGGPLFNMDGEVVGVNTAILSPNGGSIGIGFAMSSAVAKKVIAQLKEYGETRRGWLGVRIQDVSDDMAEALGLPAPLGAMVTDVPEGPARDAGIEAGDVIVTFDGSKIADTRELVRRVGDAEAGQAVPVVVLRDGVETELSVTLGRRELAEAADAAGGAAPVEPARGAVLGLTLSPMTDELRAQLDLPDGARGLVVSDIDEASEAYEKGMRAGDVIIEAGQREVETLRDFEERIEAARDAGRRSVLLLVRRAGDPRFVALSVE